MIFKFTLTHSVLGTKVISEPDGWEKATLGFDRHPDFHSLVEYFKSTFNTYGSNGTEDGGRDWLLNVEKLYGPDADLDVLVEIDYDETGAFETLYTGQIAVGMFVESLDTDHMLQVVFTQTGFWTKFISRYQSKVNIKSTTSESGVTVTAASEIDLPLPSQVIRKTTNGYYNNANTYGVRNSVSNTYNVGDYVQLGFNDVVELDELNERFDLPLTPASFVLGSSLPSWIYEAKEQGNHDLNFTIKLVCEFSIGVAFAIGNGIHYLYFRDAKNDNLIKAYVKINDNAEYEFSNFNLESYPGTATIDYDISGNPIGPVSAYPTVDYKISSFQHTQTLFLNKGDKVRVYLKVITASFALSTPPGTSSQSRFIVLGGNINGLPSPSILPNVNYNFNYNKSTKFSIVGNTVTDQTTAKAFLTHDVMSAITDRITDQAGLFYSEYLGNAFTSRVYGAQGCGSLIANAKGLHIRGYSLTEKSFFQSAKDWWDGINPIFNLGLGYEKVAGADVIRVERKEHFYDDSGFAVLLSNVQNIRRFYDSEHQFNQVEIGYQKWESQASTGTGTPSGIDDPQTKRTYNSRFKRIGKKISLLSKWVAASLTLETTRRVGTLKSANYTYDDETFAIALKSLGGGSFTPELDGNFTTLTNLTNSATRYNSKLTPARNFLRWLNFLSGCLQSYLSSSFKFASGEGNYKMTSQMSTTCEGDSTLIAENGDIPVGTDFLFIPMPYEINHYLTWDEYKAIRNNKNKAIGISQTETGHKKFFIKSLTYEIGTGRVKITAWPKETFDIQVIDFVSDDPIVSRYYDSFYESQYE